MNLSNYADTCHHTALMIDKKKRIDNMSSSPNLKEKEEWTCTERKCGQI